MRLPVEMRFNLGVFFAGLDLFHFERDAKAQREIAFRNRQIAGFGGSGIEMLVIPKEGRRHDGAGLPVDFDGFGVFQLRVDYSVRGSYALFPASKKPTPATSAIAPATGGTGT
jgi:hypothetical protein